METKTYFLSKLTIFTAVLTKYAASSKLYKHIHIIKIIKLSAIWKFKREAIFIVVK